MATVFAATATATAAATAAAPLRSVSSLSGSSARRMVVVAPRETLAVFTTMLPEVGTPSPLLSPHTAPNTVPMIVLVPGPMGSATGMRRVTAILSERQIPSVVIDLLGMGEAGRPPNADYSMTAQSHRLAVALDSLHIDRAILVAQGTSASAAFRLAARADALRLPAEPLIAAVLSLSGGAVDKQGTAGVKRALSLASLIDNPIGRALGRRRLRSAVRDQSVSDAWFTDSIMHAYLGPYNGDLRGSLRALSAMSDAVEPMGIASRLPLIRVPVRLLIGEKISGSSPTTSQVALLHSSVVDFRVDTIARSGTILQEERPDAVAATILRLLNTVPQR